MSISEDERERQKEHLRNQMIDGKKSAARPFDFLRKSRRNRVLFAVIAAAAAAAAILLAGLYGKYHTWTTYSVRWETAMNNTSAADFAVLGSSILKAGRDGVQCISQQDGEISWMSSYSMDEPQLRVSGDYALVYDADGQDAVIFDEEGAVGSFTTPSAISMADLSERGVAVVILEGPDSSTVSYYSKEGRQLDISVNLTSSSSGYPIAMAVSPDGTKLAISSYVISGASGSCSLTVYSFDSTSEAADHVIGTLDFSETDSFVPLLFFTANDSLVTAADNRLDLIAVKDQLEDTTVSITGGVLRAFHSGDRIGLLIRGDSGIRIEIYNDQGESRGTLGEEDLFDSYAFAGDDILMVSEDRIRIRSVDGKVRYDQDFLNTIYSVVSAGKSGRLYVAGKDSLQCISLR